MDNNDEKSEKSTAILLTVLYVFIMGLTLSNVGNEALGVLKSRIFYKESEHLISRTTDFTKGNFIPSHSDGTSVRQTEQPAEKDTSLLSSDKEAYPVIYRTPTGKRYHFSPACAGENRIEINPDETELFRLTPCRKCAGG